ncbi:MAG: RNA methyltransferase [Clostridia bacterium]|nr:RNA methyltransferase [Clostridia bacterium]
MIITSAQNPVARKIRDLAVTKRRKEYGEYLVEGTKPVREAVDAGCEIVGIVCTPEHEAEYPGAVVLSDDLFRRVSTEMNPQGVLAMVKVPETLPAPPEGNCVLLDGLQDCGNVGTIIRTANAAGYKEIYCVNCADAYAPKTVRASMGGIFFTKVMAGSEEEILSTLTGIPIIACDMDGENMYAFVPPPKFCLCIGNEGNGISDRILSLAQYKVSIPMEKDCESLNASVAAGIAMYHLKYNK